MSRSGKTPNTDESPPPDKPTRVGGSQKQWFTTPSSIKCLFDKFPLRTYPPNELPQRDTRDGTQHLLYIFTTPEGARLGLPSYNPSCLKWQASLQAPRNLLYVQCPSLMYSIVQAYLKFTGIPFSTVLSNNHASPTGVLPFLIPSLAPTINEKRLPLPAAKLQRWALTETSRGSKKAAASRDLSNVKKDVALEKGGSGAKAGEQIHQHAELNEGIPESDEPRDMRYDAYLSLLDNRIRNAWVLGPIVFKYPDQVQNTDRIY